jgi:hypothetical protein
MIKIVCVLQFLYRRKMMARSQEPDPTEPAPPVPLPPDDLKNVFPFIPGNRDVFEGKAPLPMPNFEKPNFQPFDPDNPIGAGTLIIKLAGLENTEYKFSDYGYVLLLEGVEDNVVGLKAYPSQLTSGFLSAAVAKKPTKIKVTILTKKSVPIQLA